MSVPQALPGWDKTNGKLNKALSDLINVGTATMEQNYNQTSRMEAHKKVREVMMGPCLTLLASTIEASHKQLQPMLQSLIEEKAHEQPDPSGLGCLVRTISDNAAWVKEKRKQLKKMKAECKKNKAQK